ncbi:hypothetical protein [Cupriavidus pampae]|uniref:Uncharacterized protein n=1 Tax=Cupriavidus pampae TaxID=659251 RepID=A0ABM8WIJ4_9BURK|nr:hypothetical protein [Cupriavidus pampae]CAG9167027.1 hypothetical protein LMG32289_01267 [Cupriavidus pampae]
MKIKTPSVLTNDRYALAQVALYIFALVLGVTSGFQAVGAFSASGVKIPEGGNRILLFAVPAVQNAFWTIGLMYLSSKLSSDNTGVAWRICVGVMILQIIVGLLVLIARVDLISIVTLALAAFGLGSLWVGREVGGEVGEIS